MIGIKIKKPPLPYFARLFIAGTALSLAGCMVGHSVNEERQPLVEPPPSFSEAPMGGEKTGNQWWQTFGDEYLNNLIEKALLENFTLKQVHARIKEARALEMQAWAVRRPTLTGELSRNALWDKDGVRSESNSLQALLNWEIDLWKKLSSSRKAAALEHDATAEELTAAALFLTSQVADIYFQNMEERSQLALLTEQIKASETYLNLTKLRFKNGAASLVDVHQQRQQVASLRSQLPLVRSRIVTLNNRLTVLLGGVPPEKGHKKEVGLPQLPGPPETGLPAHLLINRPDLREHHKKLVAADYRLAAAVADRLPKIRIGAAIGIQGDTLSGENRFRSLFGEIAGPIFEWGKRKAEVARREAIVEEELARYTQAYLTAIEEVENALNREKEQAALINALNDQFDIARANLKETRNRYMQGLSDFLPVLTAIQSTQKLERDILLARQELISNRILLYRALGGADFTHTLPMTLNNEKSTP